MDEDLITMTNGPTKLYGVAFDGAEKGDVLEVYNGGNIVLFTLVITQSYPVRPMKQRYPHLWFPCCYRLGYGLKYRAPFDPTFTFETLE